VSPDRIEIWVTLSCRFVPGDERSSDGTAARVLGRLKRDPGLALLVLAVALGAALYAPTLGRGLVNHDDPWLVRDNWIVRDASLHSLRTIFLDVSRDTRAVLGAEYLPVRDLSVMLDSAIWGSAYGGFHLTNLVLYLLSSVLWFLALSELGIDRRVCGLALLLWAVHPAHAESVAWLAERKGLLAIALSGLVALGFARFRAGRHGAWLAVAVVAAVAAVWSKALAAFSIAALGGLELALPARRVSWRHSLVALGALAAATAAAFVPVLVVASRMSVVSVDAAAPGNVGWAAMVAGIHGFYVRLGLLAVPSSVSYPIQTDGPTVLDIVLGASALAAVVAVAAVPRIGRWRVAPPLRAAALIWLAGWFPASRLLLPVRLVIAADRYLLFPTLGLALAVAVGICALPRRRTAIALAVAIVIASGARTLVAQAAWQDSRSLWERAVESNPRDAAAWSMYAEALIDAGALDEADRAIEQGLARTSASRLVLRRALLLVRRGDRRGARAWMQRAADAGEAIAMANLAVMLAEDGDSSGALVWARKAVATAPLYTHGYRTLGKLALAAHQPDEAYAAFARAVTLEPTCTNRYNLSLALVALERFDDARVHLQACVDDPVLAARIRLELTRLPPQ
jgi:tetratricopeptide (TPR) repeat protein